MSKISSSFAKHANVYCRGLLLVLLATVAGCSSGPPVQEMSDARQAIAVAREAGASEAAPAELRAAEDYLDSALRNLSRKEYAEARQDAVEAKARARRALASTSGASQNELRR